MPLSTDQASTLELHRRLDDILVPGFTGRFISGYQTNHPFVGRYLDDLPLPKNGSMGGYSFAQEQRKLIESIQKFHRHADGIDYAEDEILVSAGSSPLLFVLMMFLYQRDIRRAHYFRPIYHSFYFFSDLLKIDLVPLAGHPLWHPESIHALPQSKEVLLLADPIWIAGHSLSQHDIATLRQWQERTGSTIIVDGTFQYLKWNSEKSETSAHLSRDQTIRLVCPTKSLAIHGIRFAYLLGPARLLQGLRWACDNATGSASAFDLHAAVRIMEIMSSPESNHRLLNHIRDRYHNLRAAGVIAQTLGDPDCGYYVMGKLNTAANDVLMNGRYFELDGYDDFVRINLLSPDIK